MFPFLIPVAIVVAIVVLLVLRLDKRDVATRGKASSVTVRGKSAVNVDVNADRVAEKVRPFVATPEVPREPAPTSQELSVKRSSDSVGTVVAGPENDLGDAEVPLVSHDIPVEPVADIRGQFSQYCIGNSGRSRSRIVPKLDLMYLDVPDTVLDGAVISNSEDIPRFTLRAASVRGLSHRHYGTVRQDSYGYVITEDQKFLVLAVADGVSAGKRSHQAAQIATLRIPKAVGRALGNTDPREIDWNTLIADSAVKVMMDGVDQLVQSGRITQEEFGLADVSDEDFLEMVKSPRLVGQLMATTVAIAIVALDPDDDGSHDVWFTRIGDTSGWIVAKTSDGKHSWESLGDVKNEGETIAESATVALPFLPAEPLVALHRKLVDGELLVLVTDGIGDPLGGGTGLAGDAFGNWWSTPPNPIEFAAQVDFDRVTFDDDRTAIALWPIGG